MLIASLAGCSGLRPVIRQSGRAADKQTRTWCEEIAQHGREVDRDGLENVLHPEAMPQFGTVLFDSARQYK
jgi:hypothetical protein